MASRSTGTAALVLGLLGCALLTGCSSHRSSLRERPGQEASLWLVDERAIFRSAHGAISEVFPSYPVTDLDGPVMGFIVRRNVWGDSYNTMVRVFAAEGTSSSKERVFGYYYEVSGEGTIMDGPGADGRVFEVLKRSLEAIGRPVKVSQVERTEYKLARDRWRLRPDTTPPPDAKSSGQDLKARLESLEDLRQRKLITEEEYHLKRKQILDSL